MLLPGTHRFNLVGGHPVLDFLNTVGSHRLLTPREDLQTPEDLVSWGLQSGWLDVERAQGLLVEIQLRPGDARAALTRVRTFREALYRVFLALCEDTQPAPEALDHPNHIRGITTLVCRTDFGCSLGKTTGPRFRRVNRCGEYTIIVNISRRAPSGRLPDGPPVP